jgi:Restriction endonuclease
VPGREGTCLTPWPVGDADQRPVPGHTSAARCRPAFRVNLVIVARGPLEQLAIAEPRVLVLADGDDAGARQNARGHLFEDFVAHILHRYGYERPSRSRLNVTADGIELDVTARHQLTKEPSIAECKAYASAVPASALDAFYGKLHQARFREKETHGFFVALPRLTAPGDEQARNIDANDAGFTYLNAEAIVSILHELDEIADPPQPLHLSSDPAVLITPQGIYTAALMLDESTRLPIAAAVWGARGAAMRSPR